MFSHCSQGWDAVRHVSLHQIPNTALAKVGIRGKTLIFFPHMYMDGAVEHISQGELAQIYNEALRPAIADILPGHISHWPPTYAAAVLQSKDSQYQYHFGTVDVPVEALPDLAANLLQRLAVTNRRFRNAFFYHEWRGIKGTTPHNPLLVDECNAALTQACAHLDMGLINLADWYIDVGLEISAPNAVLQWLEEGHGTVMEYILPSVTAERVHRCVRGSTFFVDVAASIYPLAGFRAAVPSIGRDDAVCYVQAYTTDKSPTYQLHKGAFRRHWPTDILPDKVAALLRDIGDLADVWRACAAGDAATAQPGSARLEARVGLQSVANQLRDLDEAVFRDAVISINAHQWW